MFVALDKRHVALKTLFGPSNFMDFIIIIIIITLIIIIEVDRWYNFMLQLYDILSKGNLELRIE